VPYFIRFNRAMLRRAW